MNEHVPADPRKLLEQWGAFTVLTTWLLSFALASLAPPKIAAQTFVQLTDLGSNIGPRLTRVVAQQRIGRSLFGKVGTKVSFIDQGVVYQFATDPDWSRVLIGLKDDWIHEFTNDGGPGGRITGPLGIDISARKIVYVADRTKSRIVVATFSPSTRNLINPQTWGPFVRPVDVAWDGQTNPLTTDYLYVIDDSLNQVSYWNVTSGVPGAAIWTYGTTGAGTGQFLHPSGVCVGKTAAINGGTQFTTYFYVVDRGNKRVAWLDRSAGPSWQSTVTVPGWDPTDCAVDHFGNLYVVDQTNHHIYKFSQALGTYFDSYGTYGKGPNNLDTFAWPHAISVPCGLKVVNSQTVWYCEGRLITAEQWSDSSGAVEHYMGIAANITGGPFVCNTCASVNYKTTDVAYQTIDVMYAGGGVAKNIWTNYLIGAGWWGVSWDGHLSPGVPAPDGYYYFRISLLSAYGCQSNAIWCSPTISSAQFWFHYCGPPKCQPALMQPESTEPTELFLHQRVMAEPRPLARIVAPAGATLTQLIRTEGLSV